MIRLFTNIFIPQTVYDELTRHGGHIAGVIEVQMPPWTKVRHALAFAILLLLAGCSSLSASAPTKSEKDDCYVIFLNLLGINENRFI